MRTLISVAAITAGLAVLAGCGQTGTHGSRRDEPGTPGSTPARPAAAASREPCRSPATAVPAADLVVTSGGNGKTYCVTRGTGLRVYLKSTPGRRWEPIQASSGALRPWADGHLMLALGVTGASFAAVSPGTVVISSARPACPSTSAATACQGALRFRVTVIVHPPS